jgi:hypothetical protein
VPRGPGIADPPDRGHGYRTRSEVTHSSGTYGPRAWNGSWDGAPDNPSAASAISAITRVIRAVSADFHAANRASSGGALAAGLRGLMTIWPWELAGSPLGREDRR